MQRIEAHQAPSVPRRESRASNVTAIAVPNARGMNNQAPVERSAPPESARPLVHPYARRAPRPINAPPATALERRPRDRSLVAVRQRPLNLADASAPSTTPNNSSTIQSFHGAKATGRRSASAACDSMVPGAMAAATGPAVAANAPETPMPRPAMMNDASNTTPSAIPANVASA